MSIDKDVRALAKKFRAEGVSFVSAAQLKLVE